MSFPTPKRDIVLAALAGAALATGACKLLSLVRDREPTQKGQASPSPAPLVAAPVAATAQASASPATAIPDAPELHEEQLSRSRHFFGTEGQNNIEKAFVIVVGVGGVGSHAAHMLARAGVGRLRLIDFDQVTLSSLNRHATATRADVGTPKVQALASAIGRIIPSCAVEPLQRLFDASAAEELLAGNPDFVLDCIDDRTTKSVLLHTCQRLGLRTIASLGAGAKADPTRLAITDLGSVTFDAMTMELKRSLKELAEKEPFPGAFVYDPIEEGESYTRAGKGAKWGSKPRVESPPDLTSSTPGTHPATWDTLCVYSAEPARVDMLPLELAEGETAADFGAVPGFRVRVIPVLGTLPALFGQTMATWVLCGLAGTPAAALVPLCQEATGPRLATRIGKNYSAFAERQYGSAFSLLPASDVQYMVDSLWHARSVFRPYARCGKRKAALQLVRWRPHAPDFVSNLILADEAEAEAWALGTCEAVWPGVATWGGPVPAGASPELREARLSNPYAGLGPQRVLNKADYEAAEVKWKAWIDDLLTRVAAEAEDVPFFFRGLTPARVEAIQAMLDRAAKEGHI